LINGKKIAGNNMNIEHEAQYQKLGAKLGLKDMGFLK
jgi:hypothetical protein